MFTRQFSICILIYFLIISCSINNKTEIVNIIVYDVFFDVKSTYDSLLVDFEETGLVDSIKIVGLPLMEVVLDFKIDSSKANKFKVPINNILSTVDSIVKLNQLLNYQDYYVKAENNNEVPLEIFLSIYRVAQNYRPEVYLPESKIYKYKNDTVVKVELYCKRINKRVLKKYITHDFNFYTEMFNPGEIWNEIIDGKLHNQ